MEGFCCQICFGLSKLLGLKCGHLLCEVCANGRDIIECPYCQQEAKIPLRPLFLLNELEQEQCKEHPFPDVFLQHLSSYCESCFTSPSLVIAAFNSLYKRAPSFPPTFRYIFEHISSTNTEHQRLFIKFYCIQQSDKCIKCDSSLNSDESSLKCCEKCSKKIRNTIFITNLMKQHLTWYNSETSLQTFEDYVEVYTISQLALKFSSILAVGPFFRCPNCLKVFDYIDFVPLIFNCIDDEYRHMICSQCYLGENLECKLDGYVIKDPIRFELNRSCVKRCQKLGKFRLNCFHYICSGCFKEKIIFCCNVATTFEECLERTQNFVCEKHMLLAEWFYQPKMKALCELCDKPKEAYVIFKNYQKLACYFIECYLKNSQENHKKFRTESLENQYKILKALMSQKKKPEVKLLIFSMILPLNSSDLTRSWAIDNEDSFLFRFKPKVPLTLSGIIIGGTTKSNLLTGKILIFESSIAITIHSFNIPQSKKCLIKFPDRLKLERKVYQFEITYFCPEISYCYSGILPTENPYISVKQFSDLGPFLGFTLINTK